LRDVFDGDRDFLLFAQVVGEAVIERRKEESGNA